MSIHTVPLKFETPFHSLPFDTIKNEDFLPAIQQQIEVAKADIQKIVDNSETPTFENTYEALEAVGADLNIISAALFNLNSAETNEEIQKITQEVSPLLTEYQNDILLNEGLFTKLKTVYEQKESLTLNPEQETLLEENYKSFVRNGANLSEEDKTQLREIDKELAQIKLKFGENVLAETNAYILFLEDENDLAGLPDFVKTAAKATAEEQGEANKWAFTLQYPSYIPFMKYAQNRELREKLFRASSSKAFQGNEHDNQENVKKIVTLRHQRANLLGYATHADFILEKRMAQSSQKVWDFLEDLLTYAKPAAEKEMEELKAFAKNLDGLNEVQRWDYAYYSEKLKKEKYQLNDEILKPYFQLENVIQGVFTVAQKLYGLHFEERTDIPKYHEEVQTYEVKNAQGEHQAVFYADFFPRKGKRNGAWMTSYRGQKNTNGKHQRPHISIVCNFTKPTADTPSLLTFNEVLTLFHEFGHALHGMLANTQYESLSGTSTYWDFVELPSQILENWCYQKETLDLFARHYETGATIPEELIEKIIAAKNFMEGYQTIRQLSFGLLDMNWHTQNPEQIQDVSQFEKETMQRTELFPEVEGVNMSTSFGHIFPGGYSAGYYSYKWAEVLDADAFELFQEKGIFDGQTAQAFQENILSKGGSEHPMKLYERFRGKAPDPKALLRRAGLLN